VKKIFAERLPDKSKIVALQEDLMKFTRENLSTQDKIRLHVKNFGENLNKFVQFRKLLDQKPIFISDDITTKIIHSAQEKLSSLHEVIKKFIEKELDVVELTKPNASEHIGARGSSVLKKNPNKVSLANCRFDVKIFNQDQNLDDLAQKILQFKIGGLTWNTGYNKVPIAYGIEKLQMNCVIDQGKVLVDDILEIVWNKFADEVQSVDLVWIT